MVHGLNNTPKSDQKRTVLVCLLFACSIGTDMQGSECDRVVVCGTVRMYLWQYTIVLHRITHANISHTVSLPWYPQN